MSDIHDQAMHAIFRQVLDRLLEHMAQAQRASLQLLIQRLLVAAGGAERIGGFNLLVAHGSDRRSAQLLACLRAAQLSIALRSPQTFNLRVLVVNLPGMSVQDLQNHERCFSALFLHNDSRVELLMANAERWQLFDPRYQSLEQPQSMARDALLMFGHLSGGGVDALAGSRAFLQLADVCRQVMSCTTGLSAMVTAMPGHQRRRLLAWSRRCLRAAEPGRQPMYQCASGLVEELARLHARLAQLPGTHAALQRSCQPHACTTALHVLGLDELLQHIGYKDRLDRMLGFEDASAQRGAGLDAFVDRRLLAHLHGLYSQHVAGQSYREAARLVLFDPDSEPGHGVWALPRQVREEVEERLQRGYGLGEAQLVCLMFSPIIDRGQGLEPFVQRCHPNMRVALPYLHSALQGKPCPDAVVRWLVGITGLSMSRLRGLYGLRADRVPELQQLLARRDAALRLLPSQASDPA